jgi:threonyl-tRNA synthetase
LLKWRRYLLYYYSLGCRRAEREHSVPEEEIAIKFAFPEFEVETNDPKKAEKELRRGEAVALRVEGVLRDLGSAASLMESGAPAAEVLTFDSPEGREIYRHSTSHIMAHAVMELFPDARLAIGPATDDGFYYDIDMGRALVPEDLAAIERKMSQIVKKNNPLVRREMPRNEAIEFFRGRGDTYKVEILEGLTDETVSVYEEGGFIDLCLGPHLPSTGRVTAFKLLSIAGAYWRGDEKNKMLQRIYGTAFPTRAALDEHLDFLEQVKKRDHRRLGRELDLFSMNDEIGSGLILWHPNGAMVRRTIENFWTDEHFKAGYKILYTPHMAKLDLWRKSGHLDFYGENMYSPMEVEGVPYEIKPMNCPFHIAVYKSALRSYRDLPVKYAELGTVYRFERSGVLHGLLRVRGFTQDDAHIFCREDQIEDEIRKVIAFVVFILKTFGFESYAIYLSTRPDKYIGPDDIWDKATAALEQALKGNALPYEVDEGGGAFYGPKIDIKVKDSLGRAWQCSTIQVDFNLPERFDITYRGPDGHEHRPIMIHRALMGSLERFMGVLIEHYAGAFPVWLAPTQVTVLTIAERHAPYAREIETALRERGVRAEVDDDNEKVGYKIRRATIAKVPCLAIIGDQEVEDRTVAVRMRSGETIGPLSLEAFAALVTEQIHLRR